MSSNQNISVTDIKDVVSDTLQILSGFGIVIHSFVSASNESEKAYIDLLNTLKETGYASGFFTEELHKMSNSLEGTTAKADKHIKETMGVMLGFGNVSKEVFKESVQLSYDLSQSLGIDSKEAAAKLGVALQDPINSLHTLNSVGVSFTNSQRNQIEVFARSGEVMKAQGIILDEVGKKFGGESLKHLDTFSGRVDTLAVNFENLQSSLGGLITNKGWLNSFIEKAGRASNRLSEKVDNYRVNKFSGYELTSKDDLKAKQTQLIGEKSDLFDERSKLVGKDTSKMSSANKNRLKRRIKALDKEMDALSKEEEAVRQKLMKFVEERTPAGISDIYDLIDKTLDPFSAQIDGINQKWLEQLDRFDKSVEGKKDSKGRDRLLKAWEKEVVQATNQRYGLPDVSVGIEQELQESLNYWQNYYREIGDLSSVWAIEEHKIRENNTRLKGKELEEYIALKKKAFVKDDTDSWLKKFNDEYDAFMSDWDADEAKFKEMADELASFGISDDESREKSLHQFVEKYNTLADELGKKTITIEDIELKIQDQKFKEFQANIASGIRYGIEDGIKTGNFGGLVDNISGVLSQHYGDQVSTSLGGGIAGAIGGGITGGFISYGINELSDSLFGSKDSGPSPEEIANDRLNEIYKELQIQTGVLSGQGLEGTLFTTEINSYRESIQTTTDRLATNQDKLEQALAIQSKYNNSGDGEGVGFSIDPSTMSSVSLDLDISEKDIIKSVATALGYSVGGVLGGYLANEATDYYFSDDEDSFSNEDFSGPYGEITDDEWDEAEKSVASLRGSVDKVAESVNDLNKNELLSLLSIGQLQEEIAIDQNVLIDLQKEYNTAIIDASNSFEQAGFSLKGLNQSLNGIGANAFMIDSAMARTGITNVDDLSKTSALAVKGADILADPKYDASNIVDALIDQESIEKKIKDWEDSTGLDASPREVMRIRNQEFERAKSEAENIKDALALVTDFPDEINLIGDHFQKIDETLSKSRKNIKDWTNSFKTTDLKLQEQALLYGVTLPNSMTELQNVMRTLSLDTDGLTDAEKSYLDQLKKRVEEQDKWEYGLQTGLQGVTSSIDDIFSNIRSQADSLSELAISGQSVIDTYTLDSATSKDTLSFYLGSDLSSGGDLGVFDKALSDFNSMFVDNLFNDVDHTYKELENQYSLLNQLAGDLLTPINNYFASGTQGLDLKNDILDDLLNAQGLINSTSDGNLNCVIEKRSKHISLYS